MIPPEAAGNHTAVKTQAPQRPQRGPGAGHQLQLVGDLVDHGGGQARQGGHPLFERLREVQLAPHGGLGDGGDLALGTRARGQHLDDLALHQRRVHVEHDQAFGPPLQGVVLDRHVDALLGRHLVQGGPQRGVRSRRHRDPQLQAGHRVVGDAADEVDVDPEAGHRPGHRAERGGGDGPAQHEDGVGRGVPNDRHVVAALDADVEAHPADGRFDVTTQLGAVGDIRGTAHQHAERQAVPNHHLFDIEQLDAVPGERLEEGRRDARLVHSGDGDQHRHLRCAHSR